MTDTTQPLSVKDTIRKFFDSYSGAKSKNIWIAPSIPPDVSEFHQAQYFRPASGEIALVVLNRKVWFQPFGFGWTGLTITTRAVHFCVVDDSFFASILPTKKKGSIDFSNIKSIEVAQHDTAFGAAYVGHELKINGTIAGLLRLGGGVSLDDGALAYLNNLFAFMAKEKLIEKASNNYA